VQVQPQNVAQRVVEAVSPSSPGPGDYLADHNGASPRKSDVACRVTVLELAPGEAGTREGRLSEPPTTHHPPNTHARSFFSSLCWAACIFGIFSISFCCYSVLLVLCSAPACTADVSLLLLLRPLATRLR